MDKKYHSIEDFINDDEFVQWVMRPNEQSDRFWREFMAANEDKTALIEEARNFLRLMHFKDTKLDDHSIIKIKSKIDLAISSFNHESAAKSSTSGTAFYKTGVFKVAASLLIFAIAFVLVLIVQNNKYSEKFIGALPILENSYSIKTEKGKRSVVTLEDGTQVWLNADSRITYSKDFSTGTNREVFLEGEAFFEVVENKQRPFIVNTSGLSVVVLGTAFNVKAFLNDPNIETTLVRGKVAIHTDNNKKEDITLLPNQQAIYLKNSKQVILENHIEAEQYVSWKSGQLYFKDETFKAIAEELERWYDVKIHIKGTHSEDCRFSAKIHNKTLQEVLDLFATSESLFEYKIQGKEVFITGNFCTE